MLHKFQTKVTSKPTKIKPPPKATITHAVKPKTEPPTKPKESQKPVLEQSKSSDASNVQVRIYGLGDVPDNGRRIPMNTMGIDIGTKNIVLAFPDKKKDEIIFLREINGYYVYPNPSKMMESMLSDTNKERSDGTKRAAKWIKFENSTGIYVLGKDAEELAYAHNDTLQRPMAEGGVSQDEDAMMVLASIVHGLLKMANEEIGKFDDKVHICYCTTAPAINKSSNVQYHQQVIDLIIDGYETDAVLESSSIKESHAIVLKESSDSTGIGISWGAGTVTVSYVKWGDEIYSFCWIGAGDWIDSEVARRHGYDPDIPRKKSRETPTTVCRVKESINLSDDTPTDRLELDIVLHYKILIQNVVRGIIQGFVDNEDKARIDGSINIYMAGGTSTPKGFSELVEGLIKEENPPFEIAKVLTCQNPLYAVAEGCLKAAEYQL